MADAGGVPEAGGMPEAGGLTLPPNSEELKKLEEEALHGEDLNIQLKLPDGSVESVQVKYSTEVGYVKLLHSKKVEIPVNKINFLYEHRQMIDPMSFCDHKGVIPPTIDVTVEYKA